MQFIDNYTIHLEKDLSAVDLFTIAFIDILEKYTDYVIVSGYVAILFGRSRGTDDIDIIIPKMKKEKFVELYRRILKQKYWCLNSSDVEDIYDILDSQSSVRFAREPETSPNIEIKFAKNYYDTLALKKPITLLLGKKKLKTSSLELQIAYKEEVLKSNKDIEDAKHLRLVAEKNLDNDLINKYKKELRALP